MKYLLALLLFPCCLKAQNNFKVDDVTWCKCYFFTHEILAVSFDSTVTAKIHSKDDFCPAKGDSLYYNGKVWMWHKKQLHLDGDAVMVIRPAPMKANSPAGNSLVSDDSNHAKPYYLKTETVKRAEGNTVPIKPMLYVIDGFETYSKNKADSLTRGKLQVSMNVYKGYEATATKYGKRATGGVTIITTYKPKK